MTNREITIADMCLTLRHDFGLDKQEVAGGLMTSGMTPEERKVLWDQMTQVFDNVIAPNMIFKIPDSRTLCDND